jgi:hypothetical protein
VHDEELLATVILIDFKNSVMRLLEGLGSGEDCIVLKRRLEAQCLRACYEP